MAAAIQACSASSAGGQLPSWQELAAKWSSQLDLAAKDFSAARNAVLAQMFLRSMTQLLKIERPDAHRIVRAAVAAHTRARLLDSLAIIKQVHHTAASITHFWLRQMLLYSITQTNAAIQHHAATTWQFITL